MKFYTQIDQCQQCAKSSLRGLDLICSLSNKKENFYGECSSFNKDLSAKANTTSEIKQSKKTDNYRNTFKSNYTQIDKELKEKKSFNGKVVIGIFMIVGALLWFFAGLSAGIIFYYPFILVILGIINIVRGLIKA